MADCFNLFWNLEDVLFRDVLGECRTHVSGTSARINNVKLSSAAFNGVVLNSGEVFSYNGTVGERTAAKGYQAAPAYVQGETVDEQTAEEKLRVLAALEFQRKKSA